MVLFATAKKMVSYSRPQNKKDNVTEFYLGPFFSCVGVEGASGGGVGV